MTPNVYLWDATTPLRSLEDRGERDTVTDFADNELVPRKGSILIGLRPSDDDDTLEVVALGIARTKKRAATGRSTFRVRPLLVIKPRSWSSVTIELQRQVRKHAEDAWLPRTAKPTLLPPLAAAAVLAALSSDPNVRDWLHSLRGQEDEPVDMGRDRLVQEARDAVSLAMTIADPRMKLDNDPFNGPQHSVAGDDLIAAVVNSPYVRDTEEDLLPEELRRFRKDTTVESTGRAHVAVFTGRDYRLAVFNVNKKPLEEALGVDLIYWDTERDIFTMVQYKRLDHEQNEDGSREWRYTRKSEIAKQLSLMQEYLPTTDEAADSKNWRMASPYWFKFVKRDAAKKDDGELLDGIYVPAGYLRVALEDGSLMTGPQGGFRVTYDNTLRVTKSTFADLVRRGAIGTAGAQSDDILEIMKGSAYANRAAIIAVRESWQRGRHAAESSDPLGPGPLAAFGR